MPAGPEPDRATVLVVDDTAENIDVLFGILKEHYKVRAARNGEKALKIANSDSPPDLILLDIMMPGMDGYAVCVQLKSHLPPRHIPVIFCTAMSDVADEAHGFEVGAVDYVTKPISPPVVLARVKTHLALHDQNRDLERQVRERTAELESTRLDVIRCLGKAAEYKDDNTGAHVVRMSFYSRVIGKALGMTDADADMLMHAAPMHDVGKIGTPDAILKKPGKLDSDEWEVMKEHVINAEKILGEQRSELLKMAKTIALTHHEKWDGSGYPDGLSGEDIPLVGRIAALADVFDALSSKRPYKEAWPIEKVVDIIQSESGKHFDPRLVELLIDNLDECLAFRELHSD